MAIIEVKGLGKRYKGNDFYSLKNANFTIEEGDIVGLVGKNGSGKSTLLKLLAKSQNPTEGTVFFNTVRALYSERKTADFTHRLVFPRIYWLI